MAAIKLYDVVGKMASAIKMKKNVLLIGSELGKGGAERSISLLSYYLAKQYNVTLCILSGLSREKFYETCEDVVFIDPPAHNGLYGKLKAWRYRIKKIKELKREKNIDVSISFLEGPDYVNVWTKGKEKIVLSVRGSKIHDKIIDGAKGMLRKKILIPNLYNKADQIVCVADALNKELQQHFGIKGTKIKTIYNFYETEKICTAANEALTQQEQKIFSKPVVITSGRLHVAKEQDKLIQVLSKIKKTQDVRLMILGDGEMINQLKELARNLHLTICDWQQTKQYIDADIYLMGFQKNAFKFYKHSQLFALSSSWEGFPNVLAEALICNIPVVTTDCYTGPREILNISGLKNTPVTSPVNTAVGTLLPLLQNPSAQTINYWAEAILHWLNASQPATGEFQKLTQRFTLDAMLQQWKEVIEN